MPNGAIDYSFNIPSPTQRLTGGIQQAFGIANVIGQRRSQQAAAQRQAQVSAAMADLSALERPTAADYTRVANLLPKEQADSLRSSWELLSKDKQSNQLRFAGQVLSAFETSPEIALKMLDDRADAEENAGNKPQAEEYRRWAQIAAEEPDAVKQTMGVIVSALPGGKEIIESVGKVGVEERKAELQPGILEKQASDLGLTTAQTNEVLARTKKLGIESKKAVMELESIKKGELSPEKKFDQEKKLRDEYNKRTSSFVKGTKNYNIIKSSAADKSGAGDVALITSFMKMLDEGSVVRETEFANARDTAGLLTQLKNAAQKVRTGEFLIDTQREGFARLAKQYLSAAEKEQKGVKRDLGVVVKNYSLNEQNVFGIEGEDVETVIPTEGAAPADIRSRADAILGGP